MPYLTLNHIVAETRWQDKPIVLTAHHALIHQTKGQAYLHHDVRINWDNDAYIITTEKATIDQKKRTAFGTCPVTGIGKDGRFSGAGFHINNDELVIDGPVTATFVPE